MVDLNVGELTCPEVGGGVFIPLQEICPLHRNLALDISGTSTGYIRPSTGYIRSSDRKFRCGADISAQSSGAPERSICELLASGLSEILVHRIYPAQGRKFRWGRIFPPIFPVRKSISSGSSRFRSLAKNARAGYIRGPHRIYPVGAGYFRHNVRCKSWNHLGALLKGP